MKNTTLTFPTFIVALLIFSLLSCSKKKEETPTPTSKTSILINKKWYMTAATVSPEFIVTIPGVPIPFVINDLFSPTVSSFTTCIKDDTLQFMAVAATDKNGTYKSQVKVACNGESDQEGTWAFNADETKIKTTPKTGEGLEYTVIELNETSLKAMVSIKNPIDLTDTKLYTVTATFTAKKIT